ncbi:acyl-CoA synthetase (NDP forming) [Aliiruegeria haliotis]|uniref:Acyl-CoA synthetase (NDP forming) n=1 Tax=Aliiruegeria haliotis TaxID=1280846 RepID=A0A2T0RRM3_9RHOB|nr:acetate--CoA ligase family protein [Aliiruegeria haliotis]PRY23855.1 acyl-CoA synthetase (NDP forming) [Aliiruegeria haliotis]
MAGDLTRLLRPRSIAVVGGGSWCRHVVTQSRAIGFDGAIWPVHPSLSDIGGEPAYRSVIDLPAPPDAAFIGVNRIATIDIVSQLAVMGAGGAVCLASGFLEAQAESGDGAEMQRRLLDAAGTMRLIGPNCYGFLNLLDGAALWPDQHGSLRCDRGVAILTQSSNIALNVTMQQRGLPLAYVATIGNQAQTSLAELGAAMLEDPRVTALGLHIEGIDSIRAFEALAATAHGLGKPVVALKVGRSEQARAATISHTASIAGEAAGAEALLRRLGIGQVGSLPALLEVLKLLHVAGPLRSGRIGSLSCSGGEAGLIADAVVGYGLTFPALTEQQTEGLRDALGPMVALANPLDYHTYVWGDAPALTRAFRAMLDPGLAMVVLILDIPRRDRCDAHEWETTLRAMADAARGSGVPVAVAASLAENMPEDIAAMLIELGIVPFCGLAVAVEAMDVAAGLGMESPCSPAFLPTEAEWTRTLTESAAKARLAAAGLRVPAAARASTPKGAAICAETIGFPVALKGEGFAHKAEAGAVLLDLTTAQSVAEAARAMPCKSWLVEKMVTGPVAELLIGVVRDPAHGFVLTLAAGGTLTEVLDDSASLLVPASAEEVGSALRSLRIARVLDGYRGRPAANIDAIIAAVMGLQALVQQGAIEEIEINPLICTPEAAIAADALIRTGDTDD